MTAAQFRKIALSLPGATEQSHMNHPDFRAGGKVFATLAYPNPEWGMVKLSPAQQVDFVAAHPEVFVPVKGVWGERGATSVRLAKAKTNVLRPAIEAAWEGVARKRRGSRIRD